MLNPIFVLDKARQIEAHRREHLLGPLTDSIYNFELFQERSMRVAVPIKIIKKWHTAYLGDGINGLIPTHWQTLSEQEIAKATEIYRKLGQYADAEFITAADEAELADENQWSTRTADRWLRRYRIGGLWGLTPTYNPTKTKRARDIESAPRDIATFDNETLDIVYKRRELLGDLGEQEKCSNEQVNAQAERVGVSVRTIWNYLRAYRRHGLAGLAPRQRTDKSKSHHISEKMREIVASIRLAHPDWSYANIHQLSNSKARELGEEPPPVYQVTQICKQIPEPIRLIAAKRHDEFRNKYRITYPMRHDNGVIYQIDHTMVDVLVKDKRSRQIRTNSQETRPWLTIILDTHSRIIVSAIFAYDLPNRHTVAYAIRQALLSNPGGIPKQLLLDNGKDLVANHVRQLVEGMGIQFRPLPPHQPQQKGVVERFFNTLNKRLWSTLPGYVSSNVSSRNPSAKAELSIGEIEKRFWKFTDQYHNEVHTSLKQTPLACWQENCFALPVTDERRLDLLLLEATRRVVSKQGVRYAGRIYWHSELATIVSESVVVRADSQYGAPDEIQVYHNDMWLCSAFAIDSKSGRAVTPDDIRDAQARQRAEAKESIQLAKAMLSEIDEEIVSSKSYDSRFFEKSTLYISASVENVEKPSEQEQTKTTQPRTRPRPNLLDLEIE